MDDGPIERNAIDADVSKGADTGADDKSEESLQQGMRKEIHEIKPRGYQNTWPAHGIIVEEVYIMPGCR